MFGAKISTLQTKLCICIWYQWKTLEFNAGLRSRQQLAVLNRQTSSWKKVLAGAPQGCVLGPLLFLIYINDIPQGVKSICRISADDTSLFSIVKKTNFLKII